MRDPACFEGLAAEFAATVGSALMKEIVMDL